MQIIADVSKISKTVQCNLISDFLWESTIHFTQLSIVLAKRILVFSHKMVFIENEAALVCVTMRERLRTSTNSYNLVFNLLIYLLPLKSLVFVVHCLNAFWYGNEVFPKSSSQNEVARLLVIFHLPYSKCRGVKMFLFVSLPKSKFFTRVAVLHSCRLYRTRVAFVSLVSGARVVNQTRSLLLDILGKMRIATVF